MHRSLTVLAAALLAGAFTLAAPSPAEAGDIGFSIHYSSPGYYGDVYWSPPPRYYGRTRYYHPAPRYYYDDYYYRPGYYYRPAPPVYWSGYYAPSRHYYGPRHHHRRHYDRHRHHRHRW